jgi:hypothetical protein
LSQINKNLNFAGLLLFGPENVAIIKIRCITISISIIWPILVVGYLQTFPTIFGFFYGLEGRSMYEEIKENHFTLVHFVIPSAALLSNLAMKLYSDHLHRQIEHLDAVFVVFGNEPEVASNQVTFCSSNKKCCAF